MKITKKTLENIIREEFRNIIEQRKAEKKRILNEGDGSESGHIIKMLQAIMDKLGVSLPSPPSYGPPVPDTFEVGPGAQPIGIEGDDTIRVGGN